jgi:uncharacterized protein YecT (DUF1311 family)
MIGRVLFALAFTTSPAFAELCDDPQTQVDMNYCAKYHFDRADADLNDVYGKLKAGYAEIEQAKAALTAAQRAWVTFRDAECKQDEYAIEGGSAAQMVLFECRQRLTEARTEQLRDRLNCKEGDMSCVAIGEAGDAAD